MAHQREVDVHNIDVLSLRQSMCHSSRAAEVSYLRDNLTHIGAKAADIIALCADAGQPSSPKSSGAGAHHREPREKDPSTDQDDGVGQPDAKPSSKSPVASSVRPRTSDVSQPAANVSSPSTSSIQQPTSPELFADVCPPSPPTSSGACAQQHEASEKDSHVDQGEGVGEYNDSDSDSEHETKKPKMRALTFKEKERIKKVFKPLIDSREMVTLAKIRNRLNIDSKLKPLTGIKGMEKKVADRVRTLQVKAVPVQHTETRGTTQATQKREEDPFAFVDEESSNREPDTLCLPWDPRDTKTISDRFLREGKYPGIRRAVGIFHETKELTRIYNENGKERCIDKVKNVFKAKNR